MARIQFSLSGSPEEVIPDIRITRSPDGTNGTATFLFQNPVALDGDNMEEIAGLYLIDEEGELVSREVKGKFVNGKADAIEATYVIKTVDQWNRFMRFMERYAEEQGLDFTKGEKADKVASNEAAVANEAAKNKAPVADNEDAGFQLALVGVGIMAVLIVALYFFAQNLGA
ncbi:MAG: photosystem II reaction center protein Psb28 [Merismopedia sp. SIO2A8]|nr:photosystem II reaction center protein Psb28 [Merismopedia sp. SIO2A8]